MWVCVHRSQVHVGPSRLYRMNLLSDGHVAGEAGARCQGSIRSLHRRRQESDQERQGGVGPRARRGTPQVFLYKHESIQIKYHRSTEGQLVSEQAEGAVVLHCSPVLHGNCSCTGLPKSCGFSYGGHFSVQTINTNCVTSLSTTSAPHCYSDS